MGLCNSAANSEGLLYLAAAAAHVDCGFVTFKMPLNINVIKIIKCTIGKVTEVKIREKVSERFKLKRQTN